MQSLSTSSFCAAIAALETRGKSTEITATEAEEIVEELDKLMPMAQDNAEKGDCLRALAGVCRRHVILPKSYIMPDIELGEVWKLGGVADIRTGKNGQEDVCIKTFRHQNRHSERKIKGAFYHLAVRWKNVSHPNVLPFLGFSISDTHSPFGLVTPRMLNNIKDYTMEHQDEDRLPLLVGAACGLKHLHSLDIVHGSINPRNVLITHDGKACIGDFGIVQIIDNPDIAPQTSTPTRKYGDIRYMAPERLERSFTGKESDVHSFAITAYEVLVGIEPYSNITGGGPLSTKITSGVRPTREENGAGAIPDDLWEVLESCWALEPSSRPTMAGVHRALEGTAGSILLAPVAEVPQMKPSLDPPQEEAPKEETPSTASGFVSWLRNLCCFPKHDPGE